MPDYEIFNKEEKQRLTTIWAKINVTELGTELLLMLIENNPSHIKQICPYIEEPHFELVITLTFEFHFQSCSSLNPKLHENKLEYVMTIIVVQL